MKKRFISLFLVFLIIFGTILTAPVAFAATTNKNSSFYINATCCYDDAFEVLDRINALRKENGLSALKMNSKMLTSAMQRAAEIAVNFDHTRPDGTSCFSINSDIKAENIAVVYLDPESVVNGWKESSLHYSNIMTKSYKTTGIGAVIHNGTRYWVQVFGTISTGTTTDIPADTDKNFKISVGSYKYDLSMEISNKLFVTDKSDIRILGKNYAYDRYFVINNSCFDFSTNNTSVLTADDGIAVAKSQGDATITAKGDCATITKKLSVHEFGGSNSKKCGDNVTWEYNDGVLTFSGSGDMYNYTTVFDHYGITSSDVLWVDGADTVEKVVVGEGITSLSDSAFSCFSNLKDITLPSTLKHIGKETFACCKTLPSIYLPESVETISSGAFYKCSAITSITLPSKLTEISDNLFYNCTSLKTVKIPTGVEKISQSAFSYCTAITRITIPQSVRVIDGYAFFSCTSLKSITIPFYVDTIGKKAFASCAALTKVTLKNPTTVFLENNVFLNSNSALTLYSYKNSSAQKYCSDNSLKFSALDSSTLKVNASGYTATYTGDAMTGDIVITPVDYTGNVTVKFSASKTFDYYASFSSIKELGDFHRKGAVGYEKQPKYLIDCGTYPISYCAYYDSYGPVFGTVDIVIEKAVTEFSFENEKMTIPWYSKGDNTGGFINEISGLGDLKNTDLTYTSSDTSTLIVDRYGKIIPKKYGRCTITASFDGDSNHTPFSTQFEVDIYPVGVVIVGEYTCEFFEDGSVNINRYLGSDVSLTIPVEILSNRLKGIAAGAFKGAAFEEVIIPQGVETISENGFVSCYKLVSVTIPDSVTKIESGAFSGCRKLLNVTIPQSVTYIGENALGYTVPDANGESQKIEGFVINGYAGSAAEKYAMENGFDFVALQSDRLLGDVNGDSMLSIIDVTSIQRHIARIKIFDDSVLDIADVNRDNSIDIMDATAIQLKLVGRG